jgi:hypothetical protein
MRSSIHETAMTSTPYNTLKGGGGLNSEEPSYGKTKTRSSAVTASLHGKLSQCQKSKGGSG